VHTGNLSAAGWTANGNKLKKAVSKQTAVVAGGDVLVTAGLYNGDATGATEKSYAGLNSDGSTTAFNGATGANTISSAGGATCSTTPRPGTWMRPVRSTSWSWAGTT